MAEIQAKDGRRQWIDAVDEQGKVVRSRMRFLGRQSLSEPFFASNKCDTLYVWRYQDVARAVSRSQLLASNRCELWVCAIIIGRGREAS